MSNEISRSVSKLSGSKFRQQMYAENIPQEMRELPNWVCYRAFPNTEKIGKYKKQLVDPNIESKITWAKSNERTTWGTYEKAVSFAMRNNCTGIAFALEKSLGICCVDLDDCFPNGKISDTGKTMLKLFGDTYSEKSISHNGIHIFLKGELPKEYIQRNEEIEMYDDVRFISMTGTKLMYSKSYLKTIPNLTEINKKYLGEKKIIVPQKITPIRCGLVDERVIIDELNYYPKYRALMSGDTSEYGGDKSRADIALCMGIAYYHKDINTIDSVFRQSGLYREKWDNGSYAKITIQKAIPFQKRNFDWEAYYKRQSYTKTKNAQLDI